jgi:hypothetical protein
MTTGRLIDDIGLPGIKVPLPSPLHSSLSAPFSLLVSLSSLSLSRSVLITGLFSQTRWAD